MKQTDDEILEEARDRFQLCQTYESTARVNHRADAQFCEGDSFNLYQWPTETAQPRIDAAKPILTINKTKVHVLQVVNDGRQHKPGISVRATGGGASFKSASIFEGLIRHIEYISNSQDAIDTASYSQVVSGIGYLRVVTDYASDEGFDQEIYIRRVKDPLSIYLDPDINQQDGSDARFGFCFEELPNDVFNRKYPEYKDKIGAQSSLGYEDSNDWYTEDHVRVCEYFRITETKDRLHYMPDGTVVKESDARAEGMSSDQLKQYSQKSRDIMVPDVEWIHIAGNRVISKQDWPGKFIPIVRVVGEETNINGIYDRKGIVRALRDPQLAYNIQCSAGMEAIGLQSKVPYLASVEALEGYTEMWNDANKKTYPYMLWNAFGDDNQPIPPPVRIEPPTYPQAYLQAMQVAESDMQKVTGMYQSTFGEASNERSGSAISARQRQGVNATYHFVNRLAQSVRFLGRILLDLVPKVYDTQRILKILQPDGTQQTIQIDPTAPDAHKDLAGLDEESFAEDQVAMIFNPSVGTYSIQSEVGPSFGTKREEAWEHMSQILQENPSLTPIIGDLFFRLSDWPDSDIIADRMKNMVPPQALGKANPEVEQAQQHLAQQHGLMVQLQQKITELESKALIAQQNFEIDEFKAQTERMKVVATADPQGMIPLLRSMMSEVMADHLPLMHAHAIENAILQKTLGQVHPEGDQTANGGSPPVMPQQDVE